MKKIVTNSSSKILAKSKFQRKTQVFSKNASLKTPVSNLVIGVRWDEAETSSRRNLELFRPSRGVKTKPTDSQNTKQPHSTRGANPKLARSLLVSLILKLSRLYPSSFLLLPLPSSSLNLLLFFFFSFFSFFPDFFFFFSTDRDLDLCLWRPSLLRLLLRFLKYETISTLHFAFQ